MYFQFCPFSLAWLLVHCRYTREKYTGARGELAPEIPKRAPESKKRAPPNCTEFYAKQNKECYFHASKLESSPQNL